jgi:2-haloacid dehalogenase
MKPAAVIFDAYGTLFDIHTSVLRSQAVEADLVALAVLWRRRQLEYTWLRSLMGRYEDFWEITSAALRSAVRELGISADQDQLDTLMQTYVRADVFADVKPALRALAGHHLAILSNGAPAMLKAVVHNSGLDTHFAQVISVDQEKIYKPSARAYALGPQALRLSAEEILFVSANFWDAAGAKAFGYRVCWCNRTGAAPEQLSAPPDFVVAELGEISNMFR